MTSIGEIFFGCYWRIEKDQREEAEAVLKNALEADDEADFNDMVDVLSEKYKAHVSFHDDGARTIVFGRQLTTVTEAENKFDEMALLRVMDLGKGVLQENVRNEVRTQLDEVPYSLREHLSSPGFCVAWSTS